MSFAKPQIITNDMTAGVFGILLQGIVGRRGGRGEPLKNAYIRDKDKPQNKNK